MSATSHEKLIARVKERALNPLRRAEVRPLETSSEPLVPATPEQLATVESTMGVKFPTLLRRLYLEVANGGFGPGTGIIELESVANLHADLLDSTTDNPAWFWPPIMVPIADQAGVYTCVDCSTEAARVVEFDSRELDGQDSDGGWSDAFSERSGTLQAWLEEWLDGQHPPQTATPAETASWIPGMFDPPESAI
jgi:hypothetical protein